jgi:hypothetical protein
MRCAGSLRRGSVVICYLTALILAGACGAGGTPGEAPRPPRDDSAPSQPSSNATNATNEGQQSSGKHPDGIFVAQPTETCTRLQVGSAPSPLRVERLSSLVICFLGFDENAQGVELDVTLPDGSQSSQRLSKEGEAFYWRFWTTLDTALGAYKFTATEILDDGTATPLELSGEVDVERATEPSAYTEEGIASPGGSIPIQFAGFPPRTAVQLFLYRRPDGARYNFVRALPVAQTNSRGEARYTWRPAADDEAGDYLIWPGSTSEGCFACAFASIQ